jgi:hypothetical protein
LSGFADNFFRLGSEHFELRYDIVGFMVTTKSKSTQKTKKPVSAAKTSITKSTKATSTKTVVKRALNPLERLRSVHLSSALVNVLFAGLVIGFVSTNAVAIRLGIQARDHFANGADVVLAPANEVLFNIQPKYVLVAALLVSALFSVLVATKLRSRYEATVANTTSGFRWLAVGISAALALNFIDLLAGIYDVELLKLSGFMIALSAALAFMSERENAGSAKPKWLAYWLSVITGVVAWLPVLATLIGTSVYGIERYGWHVYALVAAGLLGSLAYVVTRYRSISGNRQLGYLNLEEKYLRIDMLTKFAIVIIVILALK